eukprot:m.58095 g.58095  ORF g.58095 m.58095 type:complete len:91 (+) comp34788_c0_seq3:207-479(+)
MEDVQQRLSSAVENHANELEVSTFRPIQKEAFVCSAKCCDLPGDKEHVERCLQACLMPVSHAQQYIDAEMQQFVVTTPFDWIRSELNPRT